MAGWVCYGNEAKQRDLGVRALTLRKHGAVSEAVVTELVRGALRRSGARHAIAISGIAGIHALGGTSARALAGLRGDKGTPGISVDLRDGSVDIDITMSIEFGASVPAIAEACRKAVTEQVQSTTGLPVRAVNVMVHDIAVPEDQAVSPD